MAVIQGFSRTNKQMLLKSKKDYNTWHILQIKSLVVFPRVNVKDNMV